MLFCFKFQEFQLYPQRAGHTLEHFLQNILEGKLNSSECQNLSLSLFFLCPTSSLECSPTHSPQWHTHAHTQKCIPSSQPEQPTMKLSQKISFWSHFPSLRPNLERSNPRNGDYHDALTQKPEHRPSKYATLRGRNSLSGTQTRSSVLLEREPSLASQPMSSFRPNWKPERRPWSVSHPTPTVSHYEPQTMPQHLTCRWGPGQMINHLFHIREVRGPVHSDWSYCAEVQWQLWPIVGVS